MKDVATMVKEIQAAKNAGAKFVTYGDGDLGIAIAIDEAIADISSMDDEQIGEGTWYVCDEEGNIA